MTTMASPKSASTLNNYFSFGGYPEPAESSTPSVLDLCIKSKKRSPSPEGAAHFNGYESGIKTNNNNIDNNTIINNNAPENKKTSLHITIPSVPNCRTPDSQTYSDNSSDQYCMPESSACSPYSSNSQKPSRPFKAYPKALLTTPDVFVDPVSIAAYNEFRKQMLAQVSSTTSNKNMRRNNANNGSHVDDPAYWEKRRKNNEAAKRSRDARRAKEDEMAIRCAFLERENIRLKCEIAALKSQLDNGRIYYNYA